MKRWQILAVLVMMVAVGISGWAAQMVDNDVMSIGGWGNDAETGSEGGDILYYVLSPGNGAYYRLEISSLDGHRFNALFVNESSMDDAVYHGAPAIYIADRSMLNTTSVTLEGQLPQGTEVYAFLVVSAEPGVKVHIDSSGWQGPFPPSLRPVLQTVIIICQVSSVALFFLLLHVYDLYRREQGPRIS